MQPTCLRACRSRAPLGAAVHHSLTDPPTPVGSPGPPPGVGTATWTPGPPTATWPPGYTPSPWPTNTGTPPVGGGGQLCGLAGQPPCNVFVTNIPDVGPSPTVFGAPQIATVLALEGRTAVPVPGVSTGQTLIFANPAAGVGLSPSAQQTNFLKAVQYDFGCPLDAGALGVGARVCVKFWHVEAANFGSIQIPFWPFAAALGLVVLRWVMKA